MDDRPTDEEILTELADALKARREVPGDIVEDGIPAIPADTRIDAGLSWSDRYVVLDSSRRIVGVIFGRGVVAFEKVNPFAH